MYCKQCGAPLSASDNFCQKCGTATAVPEARPAPGAAADPANHYAPPAAPISHPEAQYQGVIYAGFWRRTAALFIDIVLCYLGLVVTVLLGALAGGKEFSIASVIVIVVGYLAIFLYFPLMESSRHQGTLGKLALGIKVTDVAGHRIGFWHSFGRNVARILSGLPFYAGYIAAGVSRRKQGFHDMIAKTLVLKRAVPEWQVASEAGLSTSGNGALIAVVAAFAGLFVIGILAAIAIPAYQDYTVRAQVSEGLVAADDYKVAIAEALSTGTEPEAVASGTEPALQERSGKYFSSLMVRYGVVAIRYGGMANKLIEGHTLVLYPVRTNEGDISWVCGRHSPPPGTHAFIDNIERVQQLTDIPNKFLPAACRS